MTLSDLKRDLQIGDTLTLVEAPKMPNHKYLNITRYVVRKQGNGVYLNADKDAKSGSFLEFTNAKLTEYDGKTIKTFLPATRPLTDYEQRIYDNRPTSRPEMKERIEMEIMTDTNGSYYMDKAYFRENGCEYLMGGEVRGLYLLHDGHEVSIRDKQLKGDLELSYIINL